MCIHLYVSAHVLVCFCESARENMPVCVCVCLRVYQACVCVCINSADSKTELILKLATAQHIAEEGWRIEVLVYYTVSHAMPSSTNQ